MWVVVGGWSAGITIPSLPHPSESQATPTMDGHTFCIATTHLLFNPKAGEIKLAQVACLLAEVHSVALDGAGDQTSPVVVCGDMNSVPRSPLVTFLQDGRLDYGHLSARDIAGYYRNIGSGRRRIPTPLLPPALGIGADCKYYIGSGDPGKLKEGGMASPATGSANRLSPGSRLLPLPSNTLTTPPLYPTPPRTSISCTPLGSTSDPTISPLADKGSCNDSPQGVGTSGGPQGVITHPFTLHSAYGHAPHNHGIATTYHQAAFETVDYIMFAPVCAGSDGRARGLRLLSRKAIPHHSALRRLGPQPHRFLSSDHLLLQATFQLVC